MVISKRIIICPGCYGEGVKDKYIGDGKYEKEKCPYCGGERVIREEIHHYQILND